MSQDFVSDRTRPKLFKGGVATVGRDSPNSLCDKDLVTFEEGAVAADQHDAAGFIELNALRPRTLAKRKRKAKAKAGKKNRREPLVRVSAGICSFTRRARCREAVGTPRPPPPGRSARGTACSTR